MLARAGAGNAQMEKCVEHAGVGFHTIRVGLVSARYNVWFLTKQVGGSRQMCKTVMLCCQLRPRRLIATLMLLLRPSQRLIGRQYRLRCHPRLSI